MAVTADGHGSKPATKDWDLHIHVFEEGRTTTARVMMETGDTIVEGRGEAHRNPVDTSVPEIGDELAVGRALLSLGERLMHIAAMDVEGISRRRSGTIEAS